MHYKISGTGNAIVLLHGFIEEGSMWNGVAKVLSSKFKVIVPDLEGFGNSKLQTSNSKLSMEKYADDVFEMLKKEKVKKCIMLGHSMGGYITLHFAETYSELLWGIGLINSHCFADTLERKANRKKGNEFIAKHGTALFVRELYSNLFHPSFKNKKLIKILTERAEKYSPEALIAANTAMLNRKSKEGVLKTFAVPVLMINGKQDESVPFNLSAQQASIPTIADIHFYNECKHMSIFEKKKESTAAIERFCCRCFN